MATVAAAPASAVTVQFAPGVTTTVNNGTVLQNFNGFTPGSSVTSSSNTAAYQVLALNSDVVNVGKTPNGSGGAGDNYAAILGGGFYSIVLPSFAPVLSFLAGSLDPYNSVTLSLVDTKTGTTTSQMFSAFGNGDGRITFDTGSNTTLITAALFQSGQNSFEIDNIVSAAPEPATWAMMILGFGFAGMGLRSSRRSRGKLALA
ncbi:PEPxxWA-CTERM sorting domain-containing protein [Sphingomonas sp. RB3P16]|uniref:PEPxxWA-CTERM sorting domain-containing protein n=1 Tax=Parasphingomonas frigoris TaxID=3096163 RepID=UPI002FC6C204